MKWALFLFVPLSAANLSAIAAHDLGLNYVLNTKDTNSSRIETSEIVITEERVDGNNYKVTLSSKQTGNTMTTIFPAAVPVDFQISSFNTQRYCGEVNYFVTLRYDIPQSADIRQYFFETHAFRATSLKYLASVNGDFYDIAPLGHGVDLGFPFEMPQAYEVVCSAEGEGQEYTFSFVSGQQ